MWWQVAAALIGVWLMAAPDVLGLPEPTHSFINVVAPIATAFAVIATSEITRGLRYASSVSAAVLVIGSLILGAPMPSLLLVVIPGAVMAVVALPGGETSGSYGGGWRSLLR